MIPQLRVSGLDEIRRKFAQWPDKFSRVIQTTVWASLQQMWSAVGRRGYPPKPPNSTYVRTMTLGRSIGVSGSPDIYEVRELGQGNWKGSIGTRLEYAPYVIGSRATQQAHQNKHWWTLPEDIVNDSKDKILRLFQIAAEELVDWLNRNNG